MPNIFWKTTQYGTVLFLSTAVIGRYFMGQPYGFPCGCYMFMSACLCLSFGWLFAQEEVPV